MPKNREWSEVKVEPSLKDQGAKKGRDFHALATASRYHCKLLLSTFNI